MTPGEAPTKRKRRVYAARVPVEQRRSELLDAALHLVVTAGHTAVTMDAVAEQAGVTKPVVYGVFGNRAELLDTLLRREQEQGLAQLAAIHPDPAKTDPGDQLAHILAEFLKAVREAPDRWTCIVMPMADMPAQFHAVREEARGRVLKRTEKLASELLPKHKADLDPEIVAHTVVTLFEMAARLVLTDPERYRPERFTTAIRTALN
ncbi:DNA-binding transcriptional regulator, AcrR family [Actinokineospora alba]|uniref:DNA-binding transcriptional regulator, AcrR family n=1 Tax=Actinokineospora alba TaxID=504798 RepID=A0A1H0N9U0_9PSEU|nr:TetR/AcrR family transcriptional regulator [Actinokineospora alba]TDP68639.1 TetR family transcriptional regulator [Actinokineospora alba]SDH83405.1 DNA-binding transcriptional regulator, AcrR family [Actinokineospora alba]SDO89504.1 DNA-binding transcriptional regulator, AcrR family [Actinokineospora alba]